MQKRYQNSIMLIAVVSLVAAFGACSPTTDEDGSGATEASGIDLTVEFDEQSGAVILPYDRLIPTFYESDRLTVAASITVAECAEESGVKFTPAQPIDDPVYASEEYFGPWTVSQAEQFGFVSPQSKNDMIANGISGADESGATDSEAEISAPNGDLTDEDWAVIDDCNSEVGQFTEATVQSGPWVEKISAIEQAILKDEEADALIDDLANCIKDQGLEPLDGAPWYPAGADGTTLSARQIELALVVVDCKEVGDFTKQMARIEARLQAPILQEYSAELIQERQDLDVALARADDVIAGYIG